jgi:16S rRNA (cytosine1402-N4)-methyltransferase
MLNQILEYLNPERGETIVDATVGTAGHSIAIIKKILPAGRLIAIDRDKESLDVAKSRLNKFVGSCHFIQDNFSRIDQVLEDLKIDKIDGVLFDLGISSFQLDNPERGFSFQSEGPLDMRLDRNSYISAYDLINNLSEKEISLMLYNFGQERWHNRIARYLVQERKRSPIATTTQLSNIVVRSLPHRFRYTRIHPATRTFQAIRIAVNRELEVIDSAISKAIKLLLPKGRICVISFHSLEDRVVKLAFKKAQSEGLIEMLTRKPQRPEQEETVVNPRSRSARLRVASRN